MKNLRQVFETELTYRRNKVFYLRGDLERVRPGSKAEARILRDLKIAETEAGLWEGRLKEFDR